MTHEVRSSAQSRLGPLDLRGPRGPLNLGGPLELRGPLDLRGQLDPRSSVNLGGVLAQLAPHEQP